MPGNDLTPEDARDVLATIRGTGSDPTNIRDDALSILNDIRSGKITMPAKKRQDTLYPQYNPSVLEKVGTAAAEQLADFKKFADEEGHKVVSQLAVPPGSQFLFDFMIHQPFQKLAGKIAKEITDKNNAVIAKSALYSIPGTTWEFWKGLPHAAMDVAQDPLKYAQAGAQAVGETMASAVPQYGAGVLKGVTVGAVDLEKGTVGIPFTSIKRRVTQPLPEALKGIGISPEVADKHTPEMVGDFFGSMLAYNKIFGVLNKFVKIPILSFGAGKELGPVAGDLTGDAFKNYAFLHLAKEKIANVATAAIAGTALAAAHVRGPDEDMEVNMLYGAVTAGGLTTIGEGISALKGVADIKKVASMVDFKNAVARVIYEGGAVPTADGADHQASRVVKWVVSKAGGLDKVSEGKFREATTALEDWLHKRSVIVPETSQAPATEIPQTSSYEPPAAAGAPPLELPAPGEAPLPAPAPKVTPPASPLPPRVSNPIVGDIAKVRDRIGELYTQLDNAGPDRQAVVDELNVMRAMQINYEDQAKESILHFAHAKNFGAKIDVVGYPDGRWTWAADANTSTGSMSGVGTPFSLQTFESKQDAISAGAAYLRQWVNSTIERQDTTPNQKKQFARILSELDQAVQDPPDEGVAPPSATPEPAQTPIPGTPPPTPAPGQEPPKTKIQGGLEGLKSVISRRATLPALAQVAVRKGQMSATDLEIGFTTKTDLKDGMYQIVGKELVPSELATDDFPVLPRADKPVINIDKNLLMRELDRASQVASTDETRYILTGAHVSFEGGTGRVQGTNGKMLSDSLFPVDKKASYAGILPSPKKIVRALRSVVPAKDGTVTISTNKDNTLMEIGTPDNYITTKMIEGNFPNTDQVRPYISQQAAVDKVELDRAMKELGPYIEANGGDSSVRMDFKNNAMTLTTSGKVAEKTVSVPAVIKKVSYVPNRGTVFMPMRGEDRTQKINPNFLAQASKNVRGASVYVGTDNWLSPIHVYGEDISLNPDLQDKERLPGAKAANKKGVEPKAGAKSKAERVPKYAERGVAAAPPMPPEQTSFEITDDLPPVIQLPELVQIAKELMDGNYPYINKRLTIQGGVLGFFRPDTGKISLAPHIFASMDQAARTLAHELGHLIDWLPDKTMARGNILGRLFSFKRFSAPIVEELFKAKEIRQELIDLTLKWKPFDPAAQPKYTKYRFSGPELYADTISVLFNNPDLLKRVAPKFYQGFFEGIDRKPEVKAKYKEIVDLIRNGGLNAEREANVKKGFESAEAQYAAEREAQKHEIRTIIERIKYEYWDRNEAILSRASKLEGEMTPDQNPIYALEEMAYSFSEEKAWLQKADSIVSYLAKNNLDWDDLGEVLFFDRVIGDMQRMKLANAYGYTPETARAQLEYIRGRMGPEQFSKLNQAAGAFRGMWNYILKRLEDAGIESPEGMQILKSNPYYATFDVYTKRLVTGYGPAITRKVFFSTVGSLEEIANPASATLMKGIALIRAANKKMAALKTVRMLQKIGDATPADTRWNGKFHEFIEPKERHRGLIVYPSNGKMVGFYVDEWVAKRFQSNPKEISVAAEILQGVSTVMKDLITGKNPGFWGFSFARDLGKTWASTPGLFNPFTLLRGYVQNLAPAYRAAFGLADPLITEMMERKMLLTYRNRYGSLPSEKQHEVLMREYGFIEKAPAGAWAPFQRFWTWMGQVGHAIEVLPKVAGYQYLKKHQAELGLPDKVLEHMIRGQIGNPDYLRRGDNANFNIVLLFANPIKEGMRADAEVWRTRPVESLFKFALGGLMPKLLMYAGAIGLMGYGTKRIYDGFSNYEKSNYFIVPLGITAQGKSVGLFIPMPETYRFLTGMLWKLMDVRKHGAMSELFNYAAGQAPSLNPMIQMAISALQVASGQNPYDYYRGRNALADTIFRAKDWGFHAQDNFPYVKMGSTLREYVKYSLNQMGFSIIHRFDTNQINPIKGDLEKMLGFPFVSNVVGRWLRVSDFGYYEQAKDVIEKVQQTEARQTLDVRQATVDRINGVDHPGIKDAAELYNQLLKDRHLNRGMKIIPFKDFLKQYDRLAEQKTGDPYMDSLLYLGQTTQQKAMLLAHFSEELSPQDFRNFLMAAVQKKLISPEAIATSGIDLGKALRPR